MSTTRTRYTFNDNFRDCSASDNPIDKIEPLPDPDCFEDIEDREELIEFAKRTRFKLAEDLAREFAFDARKDPYLLLAKLVHITSPGNSLEDTLDELHSIGEKLAPKLLNRISKPALHQRFEAESERSPLWRVWLAPGASPIQPKTKRQKNAASRQTPLNFGGGS